MRRQRFTLAGVHTMITNGSAFQFDMSDIARIRREFGVLIGNLSVIYQSRPVSSPDDDDGVLVETSAIFLSLVDDITPIQQQTITEESFYSSLEDHGGNKNSLHPIRITSLLFNSRI